MKSKAFEKSTNLLPAAVYYSILFKIKTSNNCSVNSSETSSVCSEEQAPAGIAARPKKPYRYIVYPIKLKTFCWTISNSLIFANNIFFLLLRLSIKDNAAISFSIWVSIFCFTFGLSPCQFHLFKVSLKGFLRVIYGCRNIGLFNSFQLLWRRKEFY